MDKNQVIEDIIQLFTKIVETLKFDVVEEFIQFESISDLEKLLDRLKADFDAVLNAENMVNAGDSGNMEDK